MTSSHKNPKHFWKLLNRLSCENNSTSTFVSHNSLFNHFKSLLNTTDHNEIPTESKKYGQLDYVITPEELENASKGLSPGKAVGVDNLGNDMIMCLSQVSPGVLLKLFNSILTSVCILPDWMVSYIIPIHK